MISQQCVKFIRLIIGATFFFILAVFSVHAIASEVEEINAAIQASGGKWVAGETRVSRLSPEQRSRLLGAVKPNIAASLQATPRVQAAPKVAANLPSSLDWRNYNGKNYVTSVKDQGVCGACWAFSTTAGLESQMLITENLNLDLSEETLLACDHKAGDCTGGYTDAASNYFVSTGLPAESCLPYDPDSVVPAACTVECDYYGSNEYKISDWDYVVSAYESPTVSELKNAVYAYGPIVALMNVYRDYDLYSGGIYKHVSGGFEGLHGILIVGYDDTDQCFIVKNSWDTDWGENGFFRIAYSEVTKANSNRSALAHDFGDYAIAYHRYGSVQVNITPAGAVSAGAQWNVDNGAWMNSGTVASDLQVGAHVIGFKTVSGYATPPEQSVTVSLGQTATINAVYSESLTVTIFPSTAVSAGAQWRVDGGTWNNSGATVYIGSGQHTVTFKDVAGWTTPDGQTFAIGSGDAATKTGTYTAIPSVADFTVDTTQGSAPLTVSFTDKSSGAVTSRQWNFGDGKTSSTQNPSHTYTDAGVYSVTLTVNGPGGSNAKTQSNYITVYAPPVATFTAVPVSGTVPLTVGFTDKSTGTVSSRQWDFGDGGGSTEQNPTHTYTTGGTYTVTLSVSGAAGTSTKTQSNFITVYTPALADFTASSTSGLAPLSVTFSDRSTGSVNTWKWNFGDGKTGTGQNASHKYTKAGTYNVTLTVSGPGGTNATTQTISVYTSPKANFKATPTSGLSPLTVNFTDKSTGTITGWLWNFGDNQTSTDRNPSHAYTNPGTYAVTLTATNPGGSSTKTLSKCVTVYAPAVAGFTAASTTGVVPAAIGFSDTSTGTISKWKWNFGDGKTSTQRNPTHTYSKGGGFSVTLTVSGKGGTSTVTQSNLVAISVVPKAAFVAKTVSVKVQVPVGFTDKSTGTISAWLWDFGDGQTSTDQNPSHAYTTAGTYGVTLTTTGPAGTSTKTRIGYIKVTQ